VEWHALIDKVYRELTFSRRTRNGDRQEGCSGKWNRHSTEISSGAKVAKSGDFMRIENRGRIAPKRRRGADPQAGQQIKCGLGIPRFEPSLQTVGVVNVIEPIFDNEFNERSFRLRRAVVPCGTCELSRV